MKVYGICSTISIRPTFPFDGQRKRDSMLRAWSRRNVADWQIWSSCLRLACQKDVPVPINSMSILQEATRSWPFTSSRKIPKMVWSDKAKSLLWIWLVSILVLHFSRIHSKGSEKAQESQATGSQLSETMNINKSLLVLGSCIAALSDTKKKDHIPYRDSKLTKLLSDSLGKSGMTIMIACVSPSKHNIFESMNTITYAQRARHIKSKPVIRMNNPQKELILQLKKQLRIAQSEGAYLRAALGYPTQMSPAPQMMQGSPSPMGLTFPPREQYPAAALPSYPGPYGFAPPMSYGSREQLGGYPMPTGPIYPGQYQSISAPVSSSNIAVEMPIRAHSAQPGRHLHTEKRIGPSTVGSLYRTPGSTGGRYLYSFH